MQVGREIKSLTGLRGVAALYVMAFHYWIGLAFSNPATTFLAHGYLAVDLFFTLSGFVMALNYSHMFAKSWTRTAYREFLGRRIARVYPLYCAATLAAFLLILAGLLDAQGALPLGALLALNLLMVQAWGLVTSLDGPSWSISAEWAAYLLFPVLLVPALFRRPAWAWISAIVCAAIIIGLTMLPAAFVRNPTPEALLDLHVSWLGFPVWRCLPEFTLGLLAFRLSGTASGRYLAQSRWITPVLCLAILLLMTLPGTDAIVVLGFPLLLIGLAGDHLPARLLASPLAELAGKLSYSIYLVHGLLTGVLVHLHQSAQAAGLAHAQSYAAAAGILLTLVLAWFAYRWIEMPGRQWLRVLFASAKPVPSAPNSQKALSPAGPL